MSQTPASSASADFSMLSDRDYTIIFARTATNYPSPPPGATTRWEAAQTSILNLVQHCESFDPDGVTLYVACRSEAGDCDFRKYEQVTSHNLINTIEKNYPPDDINLQVVLPEALEDFFRRKAAQTTKPNGEIILVIVDGEPKGRLEIAKAIVNTSNRLDRDEELGIGFVQVGQDPIAQGFLQSLDENLKSAGAQFDIVDTKAIAKITPDCLTEFLLDVLND